MTFDPYKYSRGAYVPNPMADMLPESPRPATITPENVCDTCGSDDLGMLEDGTIFCVDCDRATATLARVAPNLAAELLTCIESSLADIRDAGANRGIVDYERGRIDAYRYVLEYIANAPAHVTLTNL